MRLRLRGQAAVEAAWLRGLEAILRVVFVFLVAFRFATGVLKAPKLQGMKALEGMRGAVAREVR